MSINVSKLPVLFFSVLFLDQPPNPEYWKYPFTIFRFKHDHKNTEQAQQYSI